MNDEHEHNYMALTSNLKTLRTNLIGAFLVLMISIIAIKLILALELGKLFSLATASNGVLEWLFLIESSLIVGFLIVFPVVLIVQGLAYYRDARDLENMGVLTKGSIAQKWIDTSDGKPTYHILYVYSRELKTLQIVDEEAFQSLQPKQTIDVLHLQHAPHISRLELSL